MSTPRRTPAAIAERKLARRLARGASIHVAEQQRVARERGAFAGEQAAQGLWKLSKRELIEAALHLAALCSGDDYDDALEGGAAVERIHEELDALDAAGMI